MTTKTQTDKLLPALATWDLADLRDLQAALTGLIEALESPPPLTDAPSQPEEATLPGPRKRPTSKQGHIETKYIPRGKKVHGPYLYLRYWQGGKLKSKYLGKPDR